MVVVVVVLEEEGAAKGIVVGIAGEGSEGDRGRSQRESSGDCNSGLTLAASMRSATVLCSA